MTTEFISCETESGCEKIVPGLLYKTYTSCGLKMEMQIVLCAEKNCFGSIVANIVDSSRTLQNAQIFSLYCEHRPR